MPPNIISFFLPIFIIGLSGCSTQTEQKAVVAELKKTTVDLCIIDAPVQIQQYYLLNSASESTTILFLNDSANASKNTPFPEPDSTFKTGKFINGFYADYLSWKLNYRSPNPADTVNIGYWLRHLGEKKLLRTDYLSRTSSYRVSQNTSGSLQYAQLIDATNNELSEEIHAAIFIRFTKTDDRIASSSSKETEEASEATDILGFTHNYDKTKSAEFLHFNDLKKQIYLNSLTVIMHEDYLNSANDSERIALFADRAYQLALLSLDSKTRLEDISTLDFQHFLTNSNRWLFPIDAVHPDEQGFSAVQRLIAAKLLSPEENAGIMWGNKLSGNELDRLLYSVSLNHRAQFRNMQSVSVVNLIKAVWRLQGYPTNEIIEPYRNIRIHKDEAMGIAYYHHLLEGKHPWFESSRFNRNEVVSLSNAALFVDLVFQPLDRFSTNL